MNTYITYWRLGMITPVTSSFDSESYALEHFYAITRAGDVAFAICYSVRADGRFIFEREFKARI